MPKRIVSLVFVLGGRNKNPTGDGRGHLGDPCRYTPVCDASKGENTDRGQPVTRPLDNPLRGMPYNITDRARAERLGVIREELVLRIRPLCTRMPHDLFLELVESMAAIQLKYELRTSPADRTTGR